MYVETRTDALENAVDLGPVLFNWLVDPDRNTFANYLQILQINSVQGESIVTSQAATWYFFSANSLQVLDETLGRLALNEQARYLKKLADWLFSAILVTNNCTFGMDYSILYLSSSEQDFPSYYEPSRDQLVYSEAEYLQKTALPSYQLRKLIMGVIVKNCITLDMKNTANLEWRDRYVYRGWQHNNKMHHSFPYSREFNTLTHSLECNLFLLYHQDAVHLVLSLSPQMTLMDLENCAVALQKCTRLRELSIFLTGPEYAELEHRKKVFQAIQTLIQKLKWRFFPHVFLFTDTNGLQPLDSQVMENDYQTLPSNRGYYLSAPSVFAAVAKNIQTYRQRDCVQLSEIFTESVAQSKQSSSYIIQHSAPTERYRKSKRFEPQQLKSQLSLTVTHQYTQARQLTQNQSLEQQQNFNQQHESIRTQTQQQLSFDLLRVTLGFEDFESRLALCAPQSLVNLYRPRYPEKTGYYTEYHQQTDIRSRLSSSSLFRRAVTSRIFGRSHQSPYLYGLRRHSFVQIDANLAQHLYDNIEWVADGLSPNMWQLEEGPFSIALMPLYRFPTLVGYTVEHPYYVVPQHDDYLDIFADIRYSHFKPQMLWGALLHPEDLASLSMDFRDKLIHSAQCLLDVFDLSHPLPSDRILTECLCDLFQYHSLDGDISVFRKFLGLCSFPSLMRDHYKILLYPILIGYSQKAQQFLLLLRDLEQRGLLSYFRRIYVDYATTVDSITQLLQQGKEAKAFSEIREQNSYTYFKLTLKYSHPKHHLFLNIAQTTPIGLDSSKWPLFEKFAHHYLLFAAKLNLGFHSVSLEELQKFWQRMTTKIYQAQRQDPEAVDQCMRLFVNSVISEETGLVIAPVAQAKTVLLGLEDIIENAIHHDMLMEQLTEWQDVSVIRTDAVHAGQIDGITVVTREMALDITQLKPKTERGEVYHIADAYCQSYRVTEQELKTALNDRCIVSEQVYANLKIKLFRYLGGQSLREPIAFYRYLYDCNMTSINPVYQYFRQILFGFVVLTKTGAHFTQDFNSQILHEEFVRYLLQKNFKMPPDFHWIFYSEETSATNDANQVMYEKITGEYHEIIVTCVYDFCLGVQTFKTKNVQDGHYSLWSIYNKYRPSESVSVANLNTWMGQSVGALAGQGLAAFGLNQYLTFETAPAVFKKKFSIQRLAQFFLFHQEDLLKSSTIFAQYPFILSRLTDAKILTTFEAKSRIKSSAVSLKQLQQRKKWLYFLLSQPTNIQDFIHNVVEMELLISTYTELSLQDEFVHSELSCQSLAEQHLDRKIALQIFQFILQQRHADFFIPEMMPIALTTLISTPNLVRQTEHFALVVPLITTACMQHSKEGWLLPWFMIANELTNLDAVEASKLLQTLLLHCPWQQESVPFFLSEKLSTRQLQGIATVLADHKTNLILLTQIYRDNPQVDFFEIHELLRSLDSEESAALCHLLEHIQASIEGSSVAILSRCVAHPKRSLLLLSHLVLLYELTAQQVHALVCSTDLQQGIKNLEQELYAKNLERFVYDSQDVAQKISMIRKKSLIEGVEDQPLDSKEQARLLADYQLMMSYMLENPVCKWVSAEGQAELLTIHQLDNEQFTAVYQSIKTQLQDADLPKAKQHAYRLALLALCIEAHYRTTRKFPKNTQILCDLHGLDDPSFQIQAVKTGGGKSIISEIRAVLLCAEGWTVDMATENIELAATGLRKFKMFYEYLGVPYAKAVILPNSSRTQYQENGINHGTPANFSFFRANMALKKKALPIRVALLCDEIDAVLTTTIQYRLAGVLDPIYNDLKSWTVVLQELLAFVKEKEIFLENNCDDTIDVANFKAYFYLHQEDTALVAFLEKIQDSVLDELINSARIPGVLKDNEDYLTVAKRHQQILQQYAAPILNVGTKRPELSVSYANGVQLLLHIFRNQHLPQGEKKFLLEAITETLMNISAKNFFDFYSLIIGWTGTPGSLVELQEFYRENRLQAYYYPVFDQDLSENLGTIIVETRDLQYQTVLEKIREARAQHPGQPILLDVDSPKIAADLFQYLQAEAPDLCLQKYEGYDHAERSEDDVIQRAGQENVTTITTLSLTRGTDFETKYPAGIRKFNTAADLTESDVIQGEGRVARNGKPGQYGHIICAEDLDPAIGHISEPGERFKAHQRLIGLKRQQQRLKTRFLEDMRYYVVTHYFLALRQAADQMLCVQQGLYASSVPETQFLTVLRDFNKYSEQIYSKLLAEQHELTTEQKQEFIRELVSLYRNSLNQLLPDPQIQSFQAIEPLIDLVHLRAAPLPRDLKLKDLTVMSDALSMAWRAAGHQLMVKFWQWEEDIVSEFDAYYSGECSFKAALAQVLERREILKIPQVLAELDHLQAVITQFDWGATAETVQQGIERNSENSMVSAFARIIPQIFSTDILQSCKNFMVDYIEDTKAKIVQKRWDDLALPDFSLPWIQTWLSRIQMIFTTFSWLTYGSAFAAGPIPFILTRFVSPLIFSWLKTMVKRWFADSESTMAQVLIGLDDAGADLIKIMTLLSSKDLSQLTIDELLKDFAPLLKNKAIQLLINKMFESPEMGHTVFQFLPDMLKALEAYRHLPCSDLKKPEILMTIIVQLLQSEGMKSLVDEEIQIMILARIQALPPNFSTLFTECTVPQLFGILKALAHPRFYDFLAQLPQDATLHDLREWLATETEALPTEVKPALQQLNDYQTNHERIAQESQNFYRNLKQRFTLNESALQGYQLQLAQRSPAIKPPDPQQPWWMTILNLQIMQWLLTYTAFLVINYLMFNFAIGLVTAAFIATIVIPIGVRMASAWSQAQRDTFPKGIIPPLVLSLPVVIQQDRAPQLASSIANITPTPAPRDSTEPTSSFYHNWSLFGKSVQNALPSLSLTRFVSLS